MKKSLIIHLTDLSKGRGQLKEVAIDLGEMVRGGGLSGATFPGGGAIV